MKFVVWFAGRSTAHLTDTLVDSAASWRSSLRTTRGVMAESSAEGVCVHPGTAVHASFAAHGSQEVWKLSLFLTSMAFGMAGCRRD